MSTEVMPGLFIQGKFVHADLHVGSKQHLVFYSDQSLQLISSSKEWYADRTFKSMGTSFMQLCSIHIFIVNGESVKQVPALFVLMSGKFADD